MMKYLITILIVVIAFIAGVIYLPSHQDLVTEKPTPNTSELEQASAERVAIAADPNLSLQDNTISWLQQTYEQLQLALNKQNYTLALNIFSQAHERATSADLAKLKALIISHAALQAGNSKPESVVQLLEPFANDYSDLDAWRMLVDALASTEQWAKLLDALKKTNRLESENERYAANLKAMALTASNLSTEFERRSDRVAILNLYQQLYEEYPQYPRFQLELARAQLALGSDAEAVPLLQALVYDPIYGSLARQQLKLLTQENDADLAQLEWQAEQANAEIGQISVPLIRAGTSFLVDTKVEGFATRMLLDTGASITALSTTKIQGLGLAATGQKISLNTANGTTTSRLFRAESLVIGRLEFQNLIVAEIDLASGGEIDGLLGTDVLRQLGDQYSYVIDDQKNALIFRPR